MAGWSSGFAFIQAISVAKRQVISADHSSASLRRQQTSENEVEEVKRSLVPGQTTAKSGQPKRVST